MTNNNVNSENAAESSDETNSRIGNNKNAQPFDIGINTFELNLIATTLDGLCNLGENKILDYETEVLAANKIKISDEALKEKYWDLLINTPWIQAVIGFGAFDKLELSEAGIELMKKFGNFQNYLQALKSKQGQ